MDKKDCCHDDFHNHNCTRCRDRERLTHGMLVNDISRLFDSHVRHETETIGTAHGNRRIFFHLVHHDGISQQELVKMTHLTAPSVSVALQKMENEGLVKRCQGTEDMRQSLVYLTEKGRELDNSIHEKLKETERTMLNGFSEKEKSELKAYLLRIADNLLGEEKKEK